MRARTQARDRERRLYVIRLTTSVRPSGTSNAAIYGDITYMDITHTTLYRVYITRIILSSLLCYNHYYYGEEIDYDCILFREVKITRFRSILILCGKRKKTAPSHT